MLVRGLDDDDAVVMHQFASLDTGLETKLAQLKADSLQVGGSSHMTGDLDLRGTKTDQPRGNRNESQTYHKSGH